MSLPEFPTWFLRDESEALTPSIYPENNPIISAQETFVKEVADPSSPTGFRGIVFKDGHDPNQQVYEKLFKSITFKLSANDRARDTDDPDHISPTGDFYSGLVTVATDAQATSWDNGDESLYTRTVRPSQLPHVEEGDTPSEDNFFLLAIPNSPITNIFVELDPANTTRNNYQVSVHDNMIQWLRQSFDILANYTNTIDVIEGTVTTDGGANIVGTTGTSRFVVDTVAGNQSVANQFTLNLELFLEDDVTLALDSSVRIPSQHAVKTYVDNLFTSIAPVPTQAEVDLLRTRIDIMEGAASPSATLKANQADLLALENEVFNNRLSSLNDDIANGIITFVQSPLVPTGATGLEAINYDDMVTFVTNYTYDKAYIDALEARIAQNETDIINLQTQITTIMTTFGDYWTKAESDLRYAPINHNHDTVYHPLISAGITGDYVLKQKSLVSIVNGIVTNAAT